VPLHRDHTEHTDQLRPIPSCCCWLSLTGIVAGRRNTKPSAKSATHLACSPGHPAPAHRHRHRLIAVDLHLLRPLRADHMVLRRRPGDTERPGARRIYAVPASPGRRESGSNSPLTRTGSGDGGRRGAVCVARAGHDTRGTTQPHLVATAVLVEQQTTLADDPAWLVFLHDVGRAVVVTPTAAIAVAWAGSAPHQDAPESTRLPSDSVPTRPQRVLPRAGRPTTPHDRSCDCAATATR
jgi:hypothetical protein